MNVNLTPNITGANVNITKGATQSDLFNAVNNAKLYRDESESFSIVSENKSIESTNSALNASISATTAGDKATIATTKAAEASNSASSASASETVCIAKATIATDKADIATAQAVISTDKASEASTSASTATTQAGIATTKASEASTSASNALASANNADTSEANALTYRNQAEAFANSINTSDIVHISGTETITGDKTFSGTVSGITKTMVGLGNVTNESKETMFTSPTFTGTVSGITKSMIGLSNVDNTADSAKNVLYATTAGTASASDVYAWAKASVKPTYTASEVGLGNVTNESKATMFTNPTFTGTVTLPSTTSIGAISNTELGYLDGVTSAIQTQINSKANNSDIVNITDNQTIAGIKTFTSFPITPSASPTTNYQVANKKYVDDSLVSSSETVKGVIELATTAETQAGTDDLRAITPLKLKNSVIGLGQTRTDVTASRVLGATYTNSTGKPILVSIRFSSISNGGTLTVGGISMGSTSGGSNVYVMTTFIVMNGETYVHTGTAVIEKWIEVR